MGNTVLACVTEEEDEKWQSSTPLADDILGAVTACVGGADDEETEFGAILQDDITKNVEEELENTLQRLGIAVREFYQVPMVLDKPIGSRVLPDYRSDRSGAVYPPGEVIEVTQQVTVDGTKYLRTEDKKGWLFIHHPELKLTMLEHVPGNYIIESGSYRRVKDAASEPVDIKNGPSLYSKNTGDKVYALEDIYTVAKFLPSDGSGVTFLKLALGKGWVPLQIPGDSGDFFVKV